MHPKLNVLRALCWGLIVMGLIGSSTAHGQPLPPQPANQRGNVILVPVQSRVALQSRSKKKIRQVRFDDAANNLAIQSDAADPSVTVLTGLRAGANRITLILEDGTEEVYDVIIQTDIELLRSVLKRTVPTANIDVIPFGRSAVLTGNVAHADDVSTIVNIATQLLGAGQNGIINAMTVGGVQQVQLDVTVARVDRTRTRSRGFNFIVNGSTVSGASILGGITALGSASTSSTVGAGVGVIPSAASVAPTSAANIIFGIIPAQFAGLLQALKTEGLAKTLAEPKLVTQSGRPARILSGGQQAVLSAASGINGPGVSFQDIGTELEFLPIVYGNGKIYLEVAPRVRAVNQGLGIVTSFGTVPGFDEQSVRTSVVMESGQTFAIGGLIQTDLNTSSSKVPVLGEIPFLSFFFSQVTVTEQEQELVILVTPHLIDPMDCNQVPKRLPGKESRVPDDFELYLETMFEVTRYQRNVFEGPRNLHYKAAWKNDPTASIFPCGVNNNGYGVGGAGGCASGNCAAPVSGKTPLGTPLPKPGSLPAPQQNGNLIPQTPLPGSSTIPLSQPRDMSAVPSSDGPDALPNTLPMLTGPRSGR